jgi:hypothetical protein
VISAREPLVLDAVETDRRTGDVDERFDGGRHGSVGAQPRGPFGVPLQFALQVLRIERGLAAWSCGLRPDRWWRGPGA